jgi:serine/threonine-protein kinase
MSNPSSSSTSLKQGTLLDNRYRLDEIIGNGGMGQVWAAKNVQLGNVVAIKVLHDTVVNSDEPRMRFAREAKVMEQLGDMSKHITRVLEHGVLSDGVPYLVMELLRGEGLEVRLKRQKVMPLAEVADIVGQLCKALSITHAENIIHRDIKPQNIYLCPDPEDPAKIMVKLLDYGVAKAVSKANAENTPQGQIIGTPNYMSPEQIRTDQTVDHRADLFAVGAIAYRCATGRVAFGKGNAQELAQRVLAAMPTAPSSLNPALPPEFDAFVARCLAKDPAERYQSARELAEALHRVVEDTRHHVPRSSTPSQVDLAPARKKSTGGLVLGVILVLLALAAVGGLLLRSRTGNAGPPPTSGR